MSNYQPLSSANALFSLANVSVVRRLAILQSQCGKFLPPRALALLPNVGAADVIGRLQSHLDGPRPLLVDVIHATVEINWLAAARMLRSRHDSKRVLNQ